MSRGRFFVLGSIWEAGAIDSLLLKVDIRHLEVRWTPSVGQFDGGIEVRIEPHPLAAPSKSRDSRLWEALSANSSGAMFPSDECGLNRL